MIDGVRVRAQQTAVPPVVKRSIFEDVRFRNASSQVPGATQPTGFHRHMFRPARIPSALVTFVAVAFLAAIAPALSAQAAARRADAPPRGYGDLNFAVSQPIGDFSKFIGTGYGLTGGFVWNLDRDRVFGIRVDGGFVEYGSETIGGCLVSCRVPVDVTTTNDIGFGGIGPQLSVPTGPFRPYVNATAGFSYFFTHSSISDSDEYDNGAYDHTNHDDLVFAVTGGGGVLIPVSMRRIPVLLDLGATVHRNGQASYLRKGSIKDLPDGSIVINPIRSDANFVTYRIGVSIGISTGR